MQNRLILILTGFIFYYIKSIFLLSFSYISIFFKNKIYFNNLTIFLFSYTFVICLLVVINAYDDGSIKFYNLINFLRYYFGFLVFYILFINDYKFINLKLLILFLFSLILIEFSYLNFLDFGYKNITLNLNNFPSCILISQSSSCNFEYKSFGLFQRPHGFGANPAISSVILIALMSLYKKKSTILELFLLINIFILASGTGYILYFLYLFYKFRNNYVIMMLLFVLIGAAFIFFNKYSYISIYNLLITKYKHLSYEPNLLININNIFNSVKFGQYGGDFALSFFARNFGLVTCIIFFIFFVFQLNKHNYFAIFILVFSCLHYGAPFSIPGQIVFGYTLAYMNTNNIKFITLYDNSNMKKLFKKNIIKINIFLIIIIILISVFDYERKKNLNLNYGPQTEDTKFGKPPQPYKKNKIWFF